MPKFFPTLRSAVAGGLVAMGGAALLSGCGGGGSGGGAKPPSKGLLVGGPPTVQKLNTPLGLNGTRGSGALVFISYNLRDTEYNPCDIQIEYGVDDPINPDGLITGSETDPSPGDEYFPCTGAPGTQVVGLDSARGKGADHIFVWNSTADVKAARYVTQDYDYTPQGRKMLDPDGLPIFTSTSAIRVRMRANDSGGDPDRWSAWRVSEAFDLNNNKQPAITFGGGALFGVVPNATGTAADENVVVNINCIDDDSTIGAAVDLQAVAVDFAPVPTLVDVLPAVDTNGDGTPDVYGDGTPETPFSAANPVHLSKLFWSPATTLAGTLDTGLATSPAPGTPQTYTWDSVKDVGTLNGRYILRATPFDGKKELGNTVAQSGTFTLDNYTIFTDVGVALSTPRVGHRATVLAVGDNRVLVTGGRTTVAGASVQTAELFYPSVGSTTFGAVAATASMATARSFHTQTRLFDDRVLVTGGFNAAGAPVNSMEVFDPVLGTWTTLGANLGTARARHTAVLLSNGDVLLAGGVDAGGNALTSAVVYHVDTNTVTATTGAMVVARHSVEGALLPGGKVLIPGGKTTAGSGLLSTEIYDPATGSFVAGGVMASARSEHSVSSAVDGKVVVAGGVGLSSIEVYNPQTNTWSAAGTAMTSVRAGHTGIHLGNGSMVFAGGSNGAAVVGSGDVLVSGYAAIDNPNGVMKAPRRDAQSVLLNNGRVLIIGGSNPGGVAISSIEVFTPDAGSNFRPTAKITTPLEEQSWGFGGLFNYRLIDAETNKAKVIFQYSIGTGPWKSCTSQGGFYLDGTNDPDTIAGDINEGTVDLVTTATDSILPIDPILKNTVGDHLFIWNITADLPQADYPTVRVRVIPAGPTRGVLATTNAFKVAKNTRVIPRFEGFSAPAHGTVDVWYHLQDIDGAPGPNGDSARVEFEYGIDTNGDRQILDTDGETWIDCTEVTNPAGSEGLGAGYTLTSSKTYIPRATDSTGWHLFLWDSVRDIGSPDIGQIRNDIILRLTPYDNPDLISNPLAVESKGRIATLTSAGANGLTIDLDTVNGLFLTRVENENNALGYTSFPTVSGSLPMTGIKIDETIVFTFNQEVDPASVDDAVGLDTLSITVGGRKILGYYEADPTDYTKVRFYPQTNGRNNGSLTYTGLEDPTVLTRGVTAAITIPAYQMGDDPDTGTFLRVRNWVSGSAAVSIVNLLARNYTSAFTTSNAAGGGAYFVRGIAPTVTTANPADASTGQGLTQGFSFEFDAPISPETAIFPNLKFVVDLNENETADANDSIVPGTYTMTNSPGPAGIRKSVITFTPLPGVSLPGTSQILASFTGVTAGDGTAVQGIAGPAYTSFSTGAGSPATFPFSETFDSTTNRDSTVTTSLWNDSAFPSMLTGLRIGGTGADGTPTPNSTVGRVRTFSSKATYDFSTFVIPRDHTWRFTGGATNLPVTINCVAGMDIAGVLDVSGGDGIGTIDESMTQVTTMPPYGKRYTGSQTSGGTAFAGGAAVAGGGAGANSRFVNPGLAGAIGSGGAAGSVGGAGNNTTYCTGGGGAGHAQSGQAGGVYTSGYTPGAAGTSYGTTNFSPVITAGSGGGSGGSYTSVYAISEPTVWGGSTYQTYYFYHNGGSGGGGGGALKLSCNGQFIVRGSGVIDASGGNGGNGYYYYAGGGGAGSGGSVWIRSGAAMVMGGFIDVRGGLGGEDFGYHSFNNGGNPARYGPTGGNASHGRIRIEAPNVSSTTTNFWAGTSYNTIASANLSGGTGALGSFPGSSTTTINIDGITKDANGIMNFTTMNIPSGVTVTLTGTTPARMRFTGNVTIAGTLRAAGGNGVAGSYIGGVGISAPVISGGAAGPGGGSGGAPNGSSVTTFTKALNGNGAGTNGGEGGYPANGWLNGSYTYRYGSSSGGGGSSLINFFSNAIGTVAGAMPNCINNNLRTGSLHHYYGAGYGAYRGVLATAGTGVNDPESLTMATLAGGGGGGGGANSGYAISGSSTYFYGGSSGGGGGGAVGIETASTLTLASTAIIDLKGGNGGTYPYNYSSGGGGGGAGGALLLRANAFSIASGATIDTMGGLGANSYSGFTSYYMGCGGVGGPGLARIEVVSTNPLNHVNVFNTSALLGYSSTTGSLTTAAAAGGGDTGATVWKTAAGLSPDFHTQGIALPVNKVGSVAVSIEGAMSDPVLGTQSATLLGSQVITTTPLGVNPNILTPDAIDGFKFWRIVWKLAPSNPLPECYDTSINVDTK